MWEMQEDLNSDMKFYEFSNYDYFQVLKKLSYSKQWDAVRTQTKRSAGQSPN